MSESFYLESLSSAPTTAPSSPGSLSQASLFGLEPQTPQASLHLTTTGGSVPAFPLLSGAQASTPVAVPSFVSLQGLPQGIQQGSQQVGQGSLREAKGLQATISADTIADRRMAPKILQVKPEDIAAFKEVLKAYQTQNYFMARAVASKQPLEKTAHEAVNTFSRAQ